MIIYELKVFTSATKIFSASNYNMIYSDYDKAIYNYYLFRDTTPNLEKIELKKLEDKDGHFGTIEIVASFS